MKLRLTSFVLLAVVGVSLAWATQEASEPSEKAGPRVVYVGGAYSVAVQYEGERQGTTRNVEVELYRDEKGELHRRIAALEGNQFALTKLSPSEENQPAAFQRPPAQRLVAPLFLPGDSGIHIKVNPAVGFTEFLSLKILDPVVLTVDADGVVAADREGVRAVLHDGSLRHSDCFTAAGETKTADGKVAFNLKALVEPDYNPDGSWSREPGDWTDCVVRLEGKDGAPFITRKRMVEGKPQYAFMPTGEPR